MLYQTPLYFFLIFLECRSNQSILKEISLGCSLEGLMLKLKLQYFGHLMRRGDSLEKTLILEGIGGRRRRERQRMRWLGGITHSMDMSSGKLRGVGDGQGGLVCYGSWGRKESDTTERLNWTELNVTNVEKVKVKSLIICTIQEETLTFYIFHPNWRILWISPPPPLRALSVMHHK